MTLLEAERKLVGIIWQLEEVRDALAAQYPDDAEELSRIIADLTEAQHEIAREYEGYHPREEGPR